MLYDFFIIVELEDHVEKLQEHVNRGEAEGRSSTGTTYFRYWAYFFHDFK